MIAYDVAFIQYVEAHTNAMKGEIPCRISLNLIKQEGERYVFHERTTASANNAEK
jgi:hypothetical protein